MKAIQKMFFKLLVLTCCCIGLCSVAQKDTLPSIYVYRSACKCKGTGLDSLLKQFRFNPALDSVTQQSLQVGKDSSIVVGHTELFNEQFKVNYFSKACAVRFLYVKSVTSRNSEEHNNYIFEFAFENPKTSIELEKRIHGFIGYSFTTEEAILFKSTRVGKSVYILCTDTENNFSNPVSFFNQLYFYIGGE